ncbi:SDR family NAD(P)-dependent oxidoreductase [Fortiea sp. LEGE XX443]|uniref:SDR family oxidoreductase n=1 Tax=Fortiea sp. LEGE XX443 TaxID=1828611 RepID=UPI00187F5C7B|nr:SDR family NAD(P)-dependent oxidoreductase [Fortiea sp. LEGE XX443]MBE9008553.1 SDR family NAD(P)-dependent oxidoreductase [Fortiea sp. LEGE XX443]
MKLSKQTVLVTGGSAGIGFELARKFKQHNNRVIICGRNAEQLLKAAQEIGDIETIQCDLAQEADIYALVETLKNKVGKLSILVNNAGVQLNYNFIQADPELTLKDIDWEIDVNLNAALKLTMLCLPLLRQQPQSAIVNMSSGLAIAPKRNAPVYCATKAALHIFSKALRYQMEDNAPNVAVYEAVLPLVDTNMTRGRGKGKIPPKQVAQEVFEAIERDKYEIHVGKVKLLVLIHRILPQLAEKILRNS